MSLDLESRLRVFLASAPQTTWRIPTLEISHSAMTQVFHIWREPYVGITTVGGVPRTMQPLNFEDRLAGSEGHLDQKFEFRIDLTEAQDAFREQLDRIPLNSPERIRLVYREFLSDNLEEPQATAVLQVESCGYTKGAATLSAVAPRLNITRTGELYSPKDVPTLRGFL